MSFKQEILKLRNEGKTYNEIIKIVGCSKATVAYHCAELNNNKEIIKYNSPEIRKIPTFKNEDILNYLIETGSSRKLIASAFEIDYNDLVFYCKKKNIKSFKNLYGYSKIKQHRRNKKILCIIYKGGKCLKCGYCKAYSALDFHHTNPKEKDFLISKNMNKSWNAIKLELDKCELLCANCHRETHEELSWS